MNPMTASQQIPPSYDEYTGAAMTGPSPLLEAEGGLPQRKLGGFGGAPGGFGGALSCFAEKLWAHLSALYLLWFITFVIACCAMSQANANLAEIEDNKGKWSSSPVADDDGYDQWAARCAGINSALYGDEVFEYNGHHYQVIGGHWAHTTWRDAEYDCWGRCFNGVPGYLATVDSAGENNLLRNKLVSHNGYIDGDRAWIGGTDLLSEGTFSWIDGYAYARVFYGVGAGNNYNNFGAGEPNENGSEDCVSFDGQGYWNDDSCYREMAFFFVEFDA